MKLFMIGATGGVGKQLVQQALDAGHEVSAFVRDPSKLPVKHERLQVVVGDGLDGQQVSGALQGHDAVLCSVGGSGLGETTLMSTVTKHLIEGMKEHGIDRIVYCASAGIHKELKGISGKLVTYVLRKVLADHNRSYERLRDSQLHWTVARPMGLTNDPLVGSYLEFPNGQAPSGQKIARADVAHFMLKAIQDNQYVGQSVGLSY